jgi:signal transduction histidine kinase
MKYSDPQSPVQLRTGLDSGKVRVEVTNIGPGIPLAEQSRIFQKFVRGQAARAASVRGSGVGLAMVQRLVEAHRGKITLHSDPGQATTFTVILPEASHG